MKIILSGGGTLGPVTPLIAVWQNLKKRNGLVLDALWVGTRRGPERALVENYGISFKAVTSAKLRRAFDLRNLFLPIFLFAGYLESFLVLLRFKPDIVVTAGGFVSVPLVWAAWIMGVPVYLHQEDLKIGLANLLMAPFARAVTTVFPETAKRFPHPRVRAIGNPVREEVLSSAAISKEEARRHFGFESELPVLLALGGGTGALELNRAVSAHKENLLKHFNVIHVVGKGKGESKKESGYFSAEFLGREDLPYALRAADLAISRAGMGTISELGSLGVPLVLAPIRKSHQEENADYFSKKGAAFVLKSGDLSSGDFVGSLSRLWGDTAMAGELKRNIKAIFPDGAAEAAAGVWVPNL